MQQKSLARTNPYLRDKNAAERRVRSIASSTAIETGKSVNAIEERIILLSSSKYRAKLA